MNIVEVETLVQAKFVEYNLVGWTFVWDRAEWRLGRCNKRRKLIGLSKPYASVNSYEHVYDTIMHELAHALVGTVERPHGPEWQAMCVKIGARPSRCCESGAVVRVRQLKFVYRCPNCGYNFKEYRRLKNAKRRYHRPCGPTHILIEEKI